MKKLLVFYALISFGFPCLNAQDGPSIDDVDEWLEAMLSEDNRRMQQEQIFKDSVIDMFVQMKKPYATPKHMVLPGQFTSVAEEQAQRKYEDDIDAIYRIFVEKCIEPAHLNFLLMFDEDYWKRVDTENNYNLPSAIASLAKEHKKASSAIIDNWKSKANQKILGLDFNKIDTISDFNNILVNGKDLNARKSVNEAVNEILGYSFARLFNYISDLQVYKVTTLESKVTIPESKDPKQALINACAMVNQHVKASNPGIKNTSILFVSPGDFKEEEKRFLIQAQTSFPREIIEAVQKKYPSIYYGPPSMDIIDYDKLINYLNKYSNKYSGLDGLYTKYILQNIRLQPTHVNKQVGIFMAILWRNLLRKMEKEILAENSFRSADELSIQNRSLMFSNKERMTFATLIPLISPDEVYFSDIIKGVFNNPNYSVKAGGDWQGGNLITKLNLSIFSDPRVRVVCRMLDAAGWDRVKVRFQDIIAGERTKVGIPIFEKTDDFKNYERNYKNFIVDKKPIKDEDTLNSVVLSIILKSTQIAK